MIDLRGASHVHTTTKEKFEHIELSSIDEIKLPATSNRILIEMYDKNSERKTSSGIYTITDTTADIGGREANNVDRIGRVAKVPERLYYEPRKYKDGSMEWDTDIQCDIIDEVLMKPVASYNAPRFKIDDREYKLIPYYDLICVKRKFTDGNLWDSLDANVYEEEGEIFGIIPLNGFLICKQVMQKRINFLDILSQEKVDTKFGIVEYIGLPVKYQEAQGKENRIKGIGVDRNRNMWSSNRTWSDEGVDVKKGDKVLVRREDIHITTEDSIHARFFGGEVYFITQRKDIIAKVFE